jgi:hypothetical protein
VEAAEQELREAYASGDFVRIAQAVEDWIEAQEALDRAREAEGG